MDLRWFHVRLRHWHRGRVCKFQASCKKDYWTGRATYKQASKGRSNKEWRKVFHWSIVVHSGIQQSVECEGNCIGEETMLQKG